MFCMLMELAINSGFLHADYIAPFLTVQHVSDLAELYRIGMWGGRRNDHRLAVLFRYYMASKVPAHEPLPKMEFPYFEEVRDFDEIAREMDELMEQAIQEDKERAENGDEHDCQA